MKKDIMDNKKTILIVEDSLTQAEQLRYMLEQHNYAVKAANSGEQALKILEKLKPDLVLSDIVMPGMQGYELCKRIKADKENRYIPVILLTSLTGTEDVIQGLACGADGFITKPYNEDYLIARVGSILEEKMPGKCLPQQEPMEVIVDGKKHIIETEHQKMLNLLISSYDAAIFKNTELIKTQADLNRLNERLEKDIAEKRKAEEIIKASNQQLTAANRQLSVTEQQVKYERDYAESIIGTIREPLLILDKDLRVVSASRSFYDTFKVEERETEKKLVYELGNEQWNIPALKTLLTNILPEKSIFQNYEIEHEFKTIGKKNMILNARELKRGDGNNRLILLAIEDVTEKRKAEEIIKASTFRVIAAEQQVKDERDYAESIIGTIREPLLVLDEDLRVVSASRSFYDAFKVKEKETEGKLVYELGNGQWDIPALRILLTKILPEKSVFQNYEVEHDFKTIGKKNMILNAKELKRAGGKNRLILLAIEDITEKRKAEEIIKASNQQLKEANRQLTAIEQQVKYERDYAESIIGTIREPLLVLDKDLRVVSASRSFYDAFKVKEKETEGKLVYELGNGQWDIPALKTLLTNILPEKSIFQSYEIEHEFKAIGKKNMILNARELKRGDGKDRLILLAIEDVTEKRRREQEIKAAEVIKTANEKLVAANLQLKSTEHQLRTFNQQLEEGAKKLKESELKYKTLFETSVDGILIADIETKKFVFANPSICQMLGYTKEELENMSTTDIYLKNSQKFNISNFGAQKAGVALETDIPCLKKNTEIVYFDINVTVASIDGKDCNVGFFREVGIRKKAQEDLVKSDKKYKYLIENLNEGVWVIDKDSLTTFANERMAEMLGYTADEMLGRPFFSFADNDNGKTEIEENGHKKWVIKAQQDFEFIKKDGKKLFAVLESAPIFDDDGNYNGAIAGVIDITDRKRLEEQLLQSQKMESIGILAGGIAHDFNNLLTAIKGYSELAKESIDKTNPIYDDLNEICLAADRAADLTRQVLLFSRKQPLNTINLSLNRIIENMSKMLNRIIGEDVNIKTSLQLDLWSTNSDESKMEQIVMNLTINARDAMQKGGILNIKTENVTLNEIESKNIIGSHIGRFVRLSIQDNGSGMSGEIVQRIFEPYFTTKGLGKGTGLGLSVVYGIVKQHNGWINVYSEPGKGTTFSIYMPVSLEETVSVAEEIAVSPDIAGHGERILIVEDEEAIKKYVSRVLLKNGYSLFLAGNVKEAVAIFSREKENIDLVLSDVVLPDKNGIEMVNQFLLVKPELKIILSSGYFDDRSQQQLINGKGHRFLHKPYQLNELLVAVKETLKESVKSG